MLPGDAVKRRKKPSFWHWGLVAGWGIDGEPYVFENTVKFGVRLVPLREFIAGQPWEHVPYTGPTPRPIILERAWSQLGKLRYDLLGANCEHFVTWCQDGVAKSGQVAGALLGALLVGLVIWLDRRNR